MSKIISYKNKDVSRGGTCAFIYVSEVFTDHKDTSIALDTVPFKDKISIQVEGIFPTGSALYFEQSNNGVLFHRILNEYGIEYSTDNECIITIPISCQYFRVILLSLSSEHKCNVKVTIYAKGM